MAAGSEGERRSMPAVAARKADLIVSVRPHRVASDSPLLRRVSWMSLIMTVLRRAWIAHGFASSNKCTRYASGPLCNASNASACHRRPETFGTLCTRNASSRSRLWFQVCRLAVSENKRSALAAPALPGTGIGAVECCSIPTLHG
eukprot:1101318-Rhodomonas_salina.1